MTFDIRDYIIPLRGIPSINHLKADRTDAKPDQHQVRVYRSDPEGINLQIWRGRSVATAYLTNAQSIELKAHLEAIEKKETAT
jgi:uncharacterized beta-barrel protein YwiB (DUF1934 family)